MRSNRHHYKAAATTLAAGVLLAAMASAEAAPLRLRIDNLGTGQGLVVTDGGAGDLDPAAGAIVVTDPLGGATVVNVTRGESSAKSLTLNSVLVNGGLPSTLRLVLIDDDFAGPLHELTADVGGVLTAPIGASVAFRSYASPSNGVPALGPDQPLGLIGVIGADPGDALDVMSATFGPGAFAGTDTALGPGADPFALVVQVTVVLPASGTVSFVSEISAVHVPGPASLSLLAAGLGVLGMLPRRASRR